MLAVERLNIEIEKYRKKETAAEDNIDWTLPISTVPKTGSPPFHFVYSSP